MRWTLEETKTAVDLLKNGDEFMIIGNKLGRTQKSIKEKLNALGYNQSDYVIKKYRKRVTCGNCTVEFDALISDDRKFCSQSCSSIVNNRLYVKRVSNKERYSHCLNCSIEKELTTNKCCSKRCAGQLRIHKTFLEIENGDTTLDGRQYKKYLIHKHGAKCMRCGWCEVNPTSGKVPIELEHKDGDSSNNSLDNLELLCPNHHSLTPTYKALNKGNGRHYRMERYYEGKSY